MDRTPAARIRVAALAESASVDPAAAEILVSIALTDAAGFYRLERVPPGRYYIAAGPILFRTYFPTVASRNRATVIDLAAGAAITGLDFSTAVFEGGSISGRLVRPTIPAGSGFPGAVVLSGQALNGRTLQTPVDVDGYFHFSKVPAGMYVVRDALATPSIPSDAVSVAVAEGDVTGIQVLAQFKGHNPFPGQPGASWTGTFNSSRQLTLTGVISEPITQIRAPAPAVFLVIDVIDKSTGATNKWWVLWFFSSGRSRVTEDPEATKFKEGSAVTLSGDGARDGSLRVGLGRTYGVDPPSSIALSQQ